MHHINILISNNEKLIFKFQKPLDIIIIDLNDSFVIVIDNDKNIEKLFQVKMLELSYNRVNRSKKALLLIYAGLFYGRRELMVQK